MATIVANTFVDIFALLSRSQEARLTEASVGPSSVDAHRVVGTTVVVFQTLILI